MWNLNGLCATTTPFDIGDLDSRGFWCSVASWNPMDNERWLYWCSLPLHSGAATQGREAKEQKCVRLASTWYSLAERHVLWLAGIWIIQVYFKYEHICGRYLIYFKGTSRGNFFSFCFVLKISNKSDASPSTSAELLIMLCSGLHLNRSKPRLHLTLITVSSPYSARTISNKMLPVFRHWSEFGWGYLIISVEPGWHNLERPSSALSFLQLVPQVSRQHHRRGVRGG